MKSKQKARLMRARIIVYLIASALLFAIICALTAGYIFLSAKWQSFSFPDEYTVYYGSENACKVNADNKVEINKSDLKKEELKVGQYGDEKTVYINFSSLADFCGFYVSGDDEHMRYILPAANGSEASQFSVRAGSNAVDLNGTTIHLPSPAVVNGETLYMPIEFVDYYIEGISVALDEEDEQVFYLFCSNDAEFYLTSSPLSPSEPIDRSALDE